MSSVPDAVESYLLAEHAPVVETVVDCADAVAAGWDGDATASRDRVVPPLAATLDRANVTARLPAVLAGAVEAAGRNFPASPVAAPPYVVVTSTGPVLRATLDDGRLVVSLVVFSVDRNAEGETRYRRAGTDARDVICAEFR